MPQLALELPLVSVLPQTLPLTFTLALSLVLPLAFPRRLPLALELALALTMTLAVPLALPRELQQALPLPLAVPLPRPSWPLELAGPWGDWNSTSCASANSSPREVGPLCETEVPGNRAAVVHVGAGTAMGTEGTPFAAAGAVRRLAVRGESALECGPSVLGWCRIA